MRRRELQQALEEILDMSRRIEKRIGRVLGKGESEEAVRVDEGP